MSRQAQVGIFAILAMLLLFGVFFVITDFGTRHTGYRVGIHFNSAAGLHSGALVYFSGVTVGTVDSIALLQDNTVDVILAVNKDVDIPRESRFLIQAPLTGDPSLIIVPPIPKPRAPGETGPTPAPSAVSVLERRVLPVEEQPQGKNSASIADLLEQGQGEVRRLDELLATLQRREPALLNSLQSTIANANDLTITANRSVQQLSSRAENIASTLQSGLGQASQNVVDLTTTLDTTVKSNSGKVDTLLTSLNGTALSLNASVDSLKSLAQNKQLKDNIIATTTNIANATHTIADLTNDLRTVTGNPQTEAQLRDTVANLDATVQRANSLLASLGGTSHVYGVDSGATPAPNGGRITPPAPSSNNPGTPSGAQNLKNKLSKVARDLVAAQIRVSLLSPARRLGGTNQLLSGDRGPQTDFNLIALPHGGMNVMVGANDIGTHYTSYNLLLSQTHGAVRYGGGVLYSRLGVLASYNPGRFGFEGRAYDLRHPTFDAYGNLNVHPNASLFLGERDLTRPERRTVFGLQLQF
ncbi:MAG: MlaD family protein [Candidatus Eremiobacteraeota bacterium]|nr:MlaD family protein [Candidatus Eremiobacteraeota bacterium]